MKGVKINENYKYEGVVLGSGAKVTAMQVTVADGKVVRCDSGGVTTEQGSFGFAIYNFGAEGRKTYNYTNVPEDVDAQALVKEFERYVEADVI